MFVSFSWWSGVLGQRRPSHWSSPQLLGFALLVDGGRRKSLEKGHSSSVVCYWISFGDITVCLSVCLDWCQWILNPSTHLPFSTDRQLERKWWRNSRRRSSIKNRILWSFSRMSTRSYPSISRNSAKRWRTTWKRITNITLSPSTNIFDARPVISVLCKTTRRISLNHSTLLSLSRCIGMQSQFTLEIPDLVFHGG